jgi:hypothetical protein
LRGAGCNTCFFLPETSKMWEFSDRINNPKGGLR